jgi:hypothetical protein
LAENTKIQMVKIARSTTSKAKCSPHSLGNQAFWYLKYFFNF